MFFKNCIFNMVKNKTQLFQNAPKLVKLSFGMGCVAALPAALVISDNDDGRIVANVYGGIRFLRSIKIGLWISIDYYFSMIGLNESSPNYKFMMSRIHQRAADNILHGCLQNGGSYIKLGQGLVAMSHILPKEYIETLKVLQEKCLARQVDELKTLFKQDFGKEPTDIFKSFDSEPIAAASIAQVYKATTKDDQEVAVKVQYIDLKKRFDSDVITIKALLKAIGWMHRNFNFAWVIDDLESTLRQELDFENEGLNSERCAKDLQHLHYIYIPKVFWEYTSSRVLVTEFIEAYRINEIDKLTDAGFNLKDINEKLFEAFGHQIFQTGFVHADPHPGNILVRKGKSGTELVLLDHGLYQQVPEDDRLALSYMWKSIVLNDHENMKKYSEQLGVKDYQVFAQVLTQAPLKNHGFKLKSKLSEDDMKFMTEYAKNQFDNVMRCLQEMPRNLLLVLRNLNTIRAIAHDYGNPIDRYYVLAYCATKSAYSSGNGFGNILNHPKRWYFLFTLRIKTVKNWFQSKIYKFMKMFNLVPDVDFILAKANIEF